MKIIVLLLFVYSDDANPYSGDSDPLEFENLAERETYKDIVAQLAIELREKCGADFLKK